MRVRGLGASERPGGGCRWRSSRSVAFLADGMHGTTSSLCGGSAVLSRVWAGRRRSRARRRGARRPGLPKAAQRVGRRRRSVYLEDVGSSCRDARRTTAPARNGAQRGGVRALPAQWDALAHGGANAVLALRSAICNRSLDGFWWQGTAPPLARHG